MKVYNAARGPEGGEARRMVIMDSAYFDRLKSLSREFVITQGQVIEALMDHIDPDTLRELLQAKRRERVSEKKERTDLLRKMKALDPKTRNEIEKLIDK